MEDHQPMACNVELAKQVELNLVHYNLWSEVQVHDICGINGEASYVLSGVPPNKLDASDENEQRQWVVPSVGDVSKSLKIHEIDQWFKEIATKLNGGVRPKKVTIGLVNDDSTVVYYFIHDGVVKPRQN